MVLVLPGEQCGTSNMGKIFAHHNRIHFANVRVSTICQENPDNVIVAL